MTSSICENDILNAAKKIGGLRGYPTVNTFAGYKLFITPPDPPKLRLSDDVNVSEEFRTEYNAWLLGRFGRVDPVMKATECLISQSMGMMVMRPETAGVLSHCVC